LSKYVRLLSLLVFAILLGSACLAQESLRISRGVAPLTGQVDRNILGDSAGALVDVGQFSSARLSARGQGNTFGHDATAPSSGELGPMGIARFDVRTPFALDAQHSALWGNVTERERSLLGSHDVVVILDRSRSMDTRDCPAATPRQRPWNPALESSVSRRLLSVSRWQWCVEQAFDLTRQTAGLPGGGVTLVLFDRDYDVFEKVGLNQFSQIMAATNVGGGTLIAPPLKSQLAEFFRRRASGSQRPLAMAIITDGDPHDTRAIRSAIIDATQKMRNPREISITILQVGTDSRGQMFLQMLNDLVGEGARYDIVRTKPFSELLQVGLTRSLVDAIK
jgi:hypothetical protein